MLEEAYGKGRLCVVASVVLKASTPTAAADTTKVISVLTSLNLQPGAASQPSPLDQPSG